MNQEPGALLFAPGFVRVSSEGCRGPWRDPRPFVSPMGRTQGRMPVPETDAKPGDRSVVPFSSPSSCAQGSRNPVVNMVLLEITLSEAALAEPQPCPVSLTQECLRGPGPGLDVGATGVQGTRWAWK